MPEGLLWNMMRLNCLHKVGSRQPSHIRGGASVFFTVFRRLPAHMPDGLRTGLRKSGSIPGREINQALNDLPADHALFQQEFQRFGRIEDGQVGRGHIGAV